MMALEVGEDEAAKKLIDLRASVGFKNKVSIRSMCVCVEDIVILPSVRMV